MPAFLHLRCFIPSQKPPEAVLSRWRRFSAVTLHFATTRFLPPSAARRLSVCSVAHAWDSGNHARSRICTANFITQPQGEVHRKRTSCADDSCNEMGPCFGVTEKSPLMSYDICYSWSKPNFENWRFSNSIKSKIFKISQNGNKCYRDTYKQHA